MEEKYLVIGIGIYKEGKKKGQSYSRLCKLVEYTDKETNQELAFVDFKQTKYSSDIYEIGSIKTVTSEIF